MTFFDQARLHSRIKLQPLQVTSQLLTEAMFAMLIFFVLRTEKYIHNCAPSVQLLLPLNAFITQVQLLPCFSSKTVL